MTPDESAPTDVFYVNGVPVHALRRTDTAAFVVPVAAPQSVARIVSLRDLKTEPTRR